MGFSRFFSLFLFCLIIVSCHEEKKNANINVQLDDLADWNIREYSLSSRKIRHEIDSLRLLPLRMYADEYTRKYYASGAPFLWITRSGIDEKADTLKKYRSMSWMNPNEEKCFGITLKNKEKWLNAKSIVVTTKLSIRIIKEGDASVVGKIKCFETLVNIR